eukprot:1270051-Rhodomonas_salina.1
MSASRNGEEKSFLSRLGIHLCSPAADAQSSIVIVSTDALLWIPMSRRVFGNLKAMFRASRTFHFPDEMGRSYHVPASLADSGLTTSTSTTAPSFCCLAFLTGGGIDGEQAPLLAVCRTGVTAVLPQGCVVHQSSGTASAHGLRVPNPLFSPPRHEVAHPGRLCPTAPPQSCP